ncbi:MAG TPA: hypothetical protein VG276_26675 [Actinomycetes bacterium]|nr:hypothetical protein [Actinomycetes bacterium]
MLGREDELKGYHEVERHPNARRVPGLLLYRFDAPLFFANAGHFRRRVRERPSRPGWTAVALQRSSLCTVHVAGGSRGTLMPRSSSFS